MDLLRRGVVFAFCHPLRPHMYPFLRSLVPALVRHLCSKPNIRKLIFSPVPSFCTNLSSRIGLWLATSSGVSRLSVATLRQNNRSNPLTRNLHFMSYFRLLWQPPLLYPFPITCRLKSDSENRIVAKKLRFAEIMSIVVPLFTKFQFSAKAGL